MDLRKWPEILQFSNTLDGMLRLVFVATAGVCLVVYSMPFETKYPEKLIELYMHPWWRLLTVLLVLSAAIWCPRVGILVALVVFFYVGDMHTLLTPFAATVQ
jgi:hypothetical protein